MVHKKINAEEIINPRHIVREEMTDDSIKNLKVRFFFETPIARIIPISLMRFISAERIMKYIHRHIRVSTTASVKRFLSILSTLSFMALSFTSSGVRIVGI